MNLHTRQLWPAGQAVSAEEVDALPSVTAELNYLRPMAGRPRTYTYEPPEGTPASTAEPEPHEVVIRNARSIASRVSLDTEGFGFVEHRTAIKDFYDDEQVKRTYYPEAIELIKAVTGADRVFIFDHTVRRRQEGAEDRSEGVPRQPVARVHVDHTAKSGPERVRAWLPEDADALLKGRVQVINLWRPIRGPLLDAPLAVADARSLAPDDLVPSDLVYPQRVGETYSVTYNPAHRWFYFPELTRDEALLLKCYDSELDGRARFSPHTAFTDPTVPPNPPPRESIELRTLVFHSA